jgi:membrane protein DedA with SNARE-associated domain
MIEHLTGYTGIFLLCLLAGIGLPFPEDIALAVVGAVHVKSGSVALLPAIFCAGLGTLGRDTIVWCFGRFFGDWALKRPWIRKLIGGPRIEKARALVVKRGSLSVLAGRALIGMRVPVFFVTGTMGIPLRHFIKWDALGLMVTTPILVGLGLYLGAPLVDGLKTVLSQAGWLPWLLGGLLAVVFFVKFIQGRRRRHRETQEIADSMGS